MLGGDHDVEKDETDQPEEQLLTDEQRAALEATDRDAEAKDAAAEDFLERLRNAAPAAADETEVPQVPTEPISEEEFARVTQIPPEQVAEMFDMQGEPVEPPPLLLPGDEGYAEALLERIPAQGIFDDQVLMRSIVNVRESLANAKVDWHVASSGLEAKQPQGKGTHPNEFKQQIERMHKAEELLMKLAGEGVADPPRIEIFRPGEEIPGPGAEA